LTREVTKASRSRMAIPARVLTPFAEVDSQPIIFGARASPDHARGEAFLHVW
jgi:hypothetical protein